MQVFLQDLCVKHDGYVVYYNNHNAVDLSKNITYHYRTNHIDVRYYWIRQILEKKLIQMKNIYIDKNFVAMLTKVIPKHKLELC